MSAAAWWLGSRVWNSLRAWMFIPCVCCVGSSLCEKLITCSKESYWVGVSNCVFCRNLNNQVAQARVWLLCHRKINISWYQPAHMTLGQVFLQYFNFPLSVPFHQWFKSYFIHLPLTLYTPSKWVSSKKAQKLSMHSPHTIIPHITATRRCDWAMFLYSGDLPAVHSLRVKVWCSLSFLDKTSTCYMKK